MGFLFAKEKKKIVPEFTGLQIQTAVNVLPIPIIYGCPRTSMNIIYANGFEAVAQQASGGKGLLTGGKGETTGYKYFSTFLGAICEGPITGLIVVFDNQAVYTTSTAPDGKVFDTFYGTGIQVPWPTIETQWPDDAFSYIFTAYLAAYRWPLDSSATIPQLNFVVQGNLAGTCPLNKYVAPDTSEWFFDADPAECVFDFLINSRYGVGFPAEFLDDSTVFTSADGLDPDIGDAALSTYCQAVGFGWSLVLNNAESANSILTRWFKNLMVAPVWTGAILKFIPYYDNFASVNPGWSEDAELPLKYYEPDLVALFSLTDDDFIQTEDDEDPVTVLRRDVADIKNLVRVDYKNRYNLFNNDIAESKDENSVEFFGARSKEVVSADEYTHLDYATMSSQLQLQREVAIRNQYAFKLGWQYCILDPMDIVEITDENLSLVAFPVRIVSIEEDEKGILAIVAEELSLGAYTVTAYAREESLPPTFFDTGEPAPLVNEPAVFEPTSLMLAATGQPVSTVIVGVSGGPAGVYDSNWGGCHIWVSLDGGTYEQIGTLIGPSRHGVTTGSLAAYTLGNPDVTNTLAVDLSMSNGTLESVASAQAAIGVNLCAVIEPDGDMELLTYTTATLTGANTYNLTGLYRGFYGTTGCAHPSGSRFIRVDGEIFQTALPPQYVGVSFYVKLQSFNIWLQGLQDIGACAVYTYTPTGWGSGYSSNALAIALTNLDDIDLNTFINTTLDLGAGSSGTCVVNELEVDLGVF